MILCKEGILPQSNCTDVIYNQKNSTPSGSSPK